MEIISLVASFISIILSIYAIVFSQKESKTAKRAEQKKEAALEKEKTKMLKKIGQLTLERDFLQDCFRACDLPVPEYDKSEG